MVTVVVAVVGGRRWTVGSEASAVGDGADVCVCGVSMGGGHLLMCEALGVKLALHGSAPRIEEINLVVELRNRLFARLLDMFQAQLVIVATALELRREPANLGIPHGELLLARA